jgi:hypothetical protein
VLHREYTVTTPSLHNVRMTGPLTFLVRSGMKLNRTLCVFQFVYTWSIYTLYTTANTDKDKGEKRPKIQSTLQEPSSTPESQTSSRSSSPQPTHEESDDSLNLLRLNWFLFNLTDSYHIDTVGCDSPLESHQVLPRQCLATGLTSSQHSPRAVRLQPRQRSYS